MGSQSTDKQSILIAGATGNIGGGAAVALARRGARIVLLGRNHETLAARAETIRATLSSETGGGTEPEVELLELDFSDMASVRNAAAEAIRRYPRIDAVILSAVALIQDGPHLLPSGHEVMFATNVMGPFLFTQLLMERLQQSQALVLHVVAPFYRDIDWDDLESIHKHKTTVVYGRTKTIHRAIAAEMARRYPQGIASVAFNPGFIIDKTDPELEKRWPRGFMGLFWKAMTLLFAKPPVVAGEPIAELVVSRPDRAALNGALFKQGRRIDKPDRAMSDRELGRRLWDELALMTDGYRTHDQYCVSPSSSRSSSRGVIGSTTLRVLRQSPRHYPAW